MCSSNSDRCSSRSSACPATILARAHPGNKRLHQRWLDFDRRNKRPVIANVAIARELASWCWTLATM